MEDTGNGAKKHNSTNQSHKNWLSRLLGYIKRKAHKRRTDKENEVMQDRSARRTATATVWLAVFTVVLSVVSIATLLILRKQLKEMQAGSVDTHSLATAAGNQAIWTQRLKETAEIETAHIKDLANETKIVADQALIQAKAARVAANAAQSQAISSAKSESVLEAQLLPNIVVQHLDVRSAIVANQVIPITNNFINEGGSVAFDVQSLSTTEIRPTGVSPVFEFKVITGEKASIGAKQTYDQPIYLPPLNDLQIYLLRHGAVSIYALGEIIYSDLFHRVHHTYYCMVLDPSNGNMNGCKEQKPSD